MKYSRNTGKLNSKKCNILFLKYFLKFFLLFFSSFVVPFTRTEHAGLRNRGFGYIKFVDEADAEMCIAKCNGMKLEGRRLSFALAKNGIDVRDKDACPFLASHGFAVESLLPFPCVPCQLAGKPFVGYDPHNRMRYPRSPTFVFNQQV
jgi:hypothetical protein